MASGFWTISDGRGFSVRMTGMVRLMNEIHIELTKLPEAKEFANYLDQYNPKGDFEYNGYGGFYHPMTGENIMMVIDFREFSEVNQKMFWQAAQKTINKLIIENKETDKYLIDCLKIILDIVKEGKRNETPIKLDYNRVSSKPRTGIKKGPGW